MIRQQRDKRKKVEEKINKVRRKVDKQTKKYEIYQRMRKKGLK